MKKFQIRISEGLSYDYDKEDAKRSKEITEELKRMLLELPKIETHEMAAKEEYWEQFKALEKANILAYPKAERSRIQGLVWQAEAKIFSPRKVLEKRSLELKEELGKLNNSIQSDLIRLLEREFKNVIAEQKVNRLGDKVEWVEDKSGGWPVGVKVRKISHNLNAIEKAKELIIAFKARASSLTSLCHSDIMAKVQAFEDEVNKIDFGKMEVQEINQQEFENFRELKLL